MLRLSDLSVDTTEWRVYGPPGTGKSTWIRANAEEAVDRWGEDQVTICSLTRSAIQEILSHDLPVHPDNVTTLHAVAKRSFQAPEPAEAHVDEFAEEHPGYAGSESIPADPTERSGGSTLYDRSQYLRQRMVPECDWPVDVRKWYRVWSGWCAETGLTDFTGWIEAAMRSEVLPPQQIVYVDEAQDHTPLQLAALRAWPTRRLVLVGDDDQCLYQWSGAEPKRFFLPALPTEREKVLHQSWRVPAAVHDRASSWVQGLRERRPKDYLPTDEQGQILNGGYSLQAARLGELPEEVSWDGMTMILTTCAYQVGYVIDALIEARVPFHNPYRIERRDWNPLYHRGEFLDLFQAEDWTGDQLALWTRELRTGGVWRQRRRVDFEDFCAEREGHLVEWPEIECFFTEEAGGLIRTRDPALFRDFHKPGHDDEWDYVLDLWERPPEEREPQVIVGTIHSVKGGQADHVVLAPDLSRAGALAWFGEQRDQIIRLFYVGMTRARQTLRLCEAGTRHAVEWRGG